MNAILAALDQCLAEAESFGKSLSLADCLNEVPELKSLHWDEISEHLSNRAIRKGSWADLRVVKPLVQDHLGSRYEVEDQSGRRLLLRLYPAAKAGADGVWLALETELRLLAAANQPGLLAPITTGVEKGRRYVLTALPPAETLQTLLAALAADPEPVASLARRQRALRALAAAAKVLGQAHDLGVVHGQLRPDLIGIDPEGATISDFGSHLVAAVPGPLATLAYRAPEQLSWKHPRLDRRSDIWTLGAIAHEMVTGTTPIALTTEAQLRREAARFVPRSAKVERIGLPAAINAVINQALAPEPSRRYGSAADFGRDLITALEGGRPAARAPALTDRYLRWMRREPGIATAGFVIFALLGTAGIVSGWFVGVADRDAAVKPLQESLALQRARDRANEASARELARDQQLGLELEKLASLFEVVRFGPMAQFLLTDILEAFLATFEDRGIKLDQDLDLDAVAAIFDGAYQRSSADARRLMAGLYRLRVLLDEFQLRASLKERQDWAERVTLIERHVTIFIERCEKDQSMRHLWRVARHGEAEAYDRLDAFLDAAHWRRQSPEYLAFLADTLAGYPERSEAARLLIAEALRLRSTAGLLQIRGGLIELTEAKRRRPIDVDGLRRAILHLEIATALKTKEVAPRFALAEALALDGNFRDAILNLDEALNLAPKSAFVWLMRALFFKSHPFGQHGAEAAERALELKPHWRDLPLR